MKSETKGTIPTPDNILRELAEQQEGQGWAHHVADSATGELFTTELSRPVTPLSRLERRVQAYSRGGAGSGRAERVPIPATQVRRSPPEQFLMTPEQYLAQAESLRATGHYYLARQYENLWLLRAGRQERPPAEGSTQ